MYAKFKKGFNDGINICILTLLQCLWMWKFISLKAGLMNLLPTFLFLLIWYLFIKVEFPQKRFWLYFSPALLLTLRLPVTLTSFLEPLSWLLYLTVIALVFSRILNYFLQKNQVTLFIITVLIVLFNAIGHISLNSPYTYTFRITNHLQSNYSPRIENNQTWECPYENSEIAVSCDMRHFVVSEKIFTNPDPKKASFSVLLSRFFYGYLSSLIGFDGNRWIASFTLNLLFWILACAAIFKICLLTHLSEKIATIAMLCSASSWGFFHFVGQPSPHVAAYAYAAIALWAAIEILYSSQVRKIVLLSAILVAGPLAYEVYPVSLTTVCLLFFNRRKALGILIFLTQMLLNFLWINVSLRFFLGTLGGMKDQSSGATNILHDIQTWFSVLVHFDFPLGLKLVSTGILSYIYGGLIFGALASIVYIVYLAIHLTRKREQDKDSQLLLLCCASLCLLTLLSTIFITPQTAIWSPGTGMQPRLAFFTYPVNSIAMAVLGSWIFKGNFQYIPVVTTFLIANLTLIGLVSVAMFFDYGQVGLYWQ